MTLRGSFLIFGTLRITPISAHSPVGRSILAPNFAKGNVFFELSAPTRNGPCVKNVLIKKFITHYVVVACLPAFFCIYPAAFTIVGFIRMETINPTKAQ